MVDYTGFIGTAQTITNYYKIQKTKKISQHVQYTGTKHLMWVLQFKFRALHQVSDWLVHFIFSLFFSKMLY